MLPKDSRVCFDGSLRTCRLPSRPSLGGADLRGQTPFLLAFEGLLIGSQLQSPLFFRFSLCVSFLESASAFLKLLLK